ncbi:hypothetical protein M433DRAFT_21479 [Acidomyces richmondensis BFW]|nr:MAG: hypothetical protein FE78DRAFT_34407 [Acidomyces sp. 'richmondensis']KYG49331.1 hypothetical protein M433DRAFT_21479 [Acidomyces richmondensis BFW]
MVGTDWSNAETWQRLVAAICATGVKINIAETAKYYGTTYDTLENRLRKVKKEAAILKDEVDSGRRGEVVVRKSNPATPRKPKTPNKDILNCVNHGKITKTPVKKANVKQEAFQSPESSNLEWDALVRISDELDF